MGEMLNMREAAEACGVNRATVARWVKTGRLKHVKTETVRNLTATLVDVDELRVLADGITVGRGHKKKTRRRIAAK